MVAVTTPKVAPVELAADASKAASDRGPAAGTAAVAPLTPEDLADRLVPEEPRISPDGRSVVFAVAPRGKKGEHKEQALWLSRDGAPARPLTSGVAHDANPRWSPDGRRIIFCSDRHERGDNTFKLYLLPADGGEARPLGDLQGKLTMPSWSPDGRTVAVLREDPPSPEEKRRKEDRDDAVVVDEQPKPTRLWAVDAETGRARCLSFWERQIWSYAWTPDGEALVVLTTEAPDVNKIFDAGDLWLVPLVGALPRHVATFPVLPGDPVVVDTPDGPAVAVRGNRHRADPSDSVWTVPLAGGEPRNLLPNYPGVVEELVPRPETPGRLGVRLVERTHGMVYGLEAATGELTPLTPAGRHGRGSVLTGVSFSADGARMAMVWSDGTTPEEIYLGDAGGDGAAVTGFGEAFRDRLCPVETVRWASADGVEIEGLLTYPAGFEAGTRYPLVVEIHGGPSWQWEDRVFLDWHDWAQMLASRGYAVLAPNPRGSTGYGSDFQKLLQDDVGGGEAQDLIAGARAMVERGIADGERLGIGGWSWGGYLTAWTITQTDLFKSAVMGAGLANMISDHGQDDIPAMNLWLYPGQPYHHLDHYWQTSPIRHITNVRTPTLILHGDEDARVHPAQGMEYHRALKTLGVPVSFVRYPREGHGVKERLHQIDLMRRVVAWYDRWLKNDE
ncbi:MAG: S9 family peptidase [Chloroflexota bacterium]|nr:S9 family peptidase [Chloroflexota bacterium]